MTENPRILPVGPQPDMNYPLQVLYCGNCSLPIEYCEYHPDYDKCKQWLEQNLPDEFDKVVKLCGGGDDDGAEEKKRQKRGGKGMVKAKKKEDAPKQVRIYLLSLFYPNSFFLLYNFIICSISIIIVTTVAVTINLEGPGLNQLTSPLTGPI